MGGGGGGGRRPVGRVYEPARHRPDRAEWQCAFAACDAAPLCAGRSRCGEQAVDGGRYLPNDLFH